MGSRHGKNNVSVVYTESVWGSVDLKKNVMVMASCCV